jgi:hypothetical protein
MLHDADVTFLKNAIGTANLYCLIVAEGVHHQNFFCPADRL